MFFAGVNKYGRPPLQGTRAGLRLADNRAQVHRSRRLLEINRRLIKPWVWKSAHHADSSRARRWRVLLSGDRLARWRRLHCRCLGRRIGSISGANGRTWNGRVAAKMKPRRDYAGIVLRRASGYPDTSTTMSRNFYRVRNGITRIDCSFPATGTRDGVLNDYGRRLQTIHRRLPPLERRSE